MPRFWPQIATPKRAQAERDQRVDHTAHRLHEKPRMEREFGDLRLMTSERQNGTAAKRRSRGAKSAKAAGKTPRAASGRRHAEAPPGTRPRRRMLAVTSGKGGVGKTNIVTNL